MKTQATNNSVIIWQEGTDDLPIPEPAILVTGYSETILLEQEGRYISLNYQTINELFRVIKSLKKEQTE